MKIGVMDADFAFRKNHRFPNLACMKIAGWHLSQGDSVSLVTEPMDVFGYDKVYVSKVFTDTEVPYYVVEADNVSLGGTGFAYDDAEPLPYSIEHHMPHYSLYDGSIGNGSAFKFYRDYSIGYMTRGCFRKCSFCVNRNSSFSKAASPLGEFFDESRKKICLLDDNFLACGEWERMLSELIATGRPFVFKQGLDERMLTEKSCEMLFGAKYDGEYLFAFDDIEDASLIVEKLNMIRRHTGKTCKFYVLCGYDRSGEYGDSFWENDIISVFERIDILRSFGCLPYIMRHENYKMSPYRGMYVNLARWCNQPSLFKKMSFQEFVEHPDNWGGSCGMYFREFMADQSYLDERHLFAKWGDK